MKSFLILLLCVAALASDLVVTKEYVEYLKKTVNWEVEDYENNIFKDWTIDDMRGFLGLQHDGGFVEGAEQVEETPLPSEFNWAGAICDHGVRNQGSCGGCWAFAGSGMMSDRCCIQAKDFGNLSPQELVSCDKGSYGCYGGSLTSPATYMQQNGGLVQEDCYPYTGQNSVCPSRCNNGADWKTSHHCKCNKITNCYGTLGIKNCMMKGPVPIGFGVCQSFMSYKSGTYTCDCNGSYIGGHATVALGYGEYPSCYYYVRNSWGTSWGMNGYYMMACDTCDLSGGAVCDQITA